MYVLSTCSHFSLSLSLDSVSLFLSCAAHPYKYILAQLARLHSVSQLDCEALFETTRLRASFSSCVSMCMRYVLVLHLLRSLAFQALSLFSLFLSLSLSHSLTLSLHVQQAFSEQLLVTWLQKKHFISGVFPSSLLLL